MRRALPLLALAACGAPTLIVVEVHGEQRVPDDVDALYLELTDPDDGRRLSVLDLALEQQQLPVEIGLEPTSTTPSRVRVDVRARRSGADVARVAALFDWREETVTRVQLPALE